MSSKIPFTLAEARRFGRLMDFADAAPSMVRRERFDALLAAMAQAGPPAKRRRRPPSARGSPGQRAARSDS